MIYQANTKQENAGVPLFKANGIFRVKNSHYILIKIETQQKQFYQRIHGEKLALNVYSKGESLNINMPSIQLKM